MKKNKVFVVASIAAILFSFAALIVSGTKITAENHTIVYLYWSLEFFLILILIMLFSVLNRLNSIGKTERTGPWTLRSWWSDLDKNVFTKAVDVAHEKDILLDHDYDGIKELDNSLPPWWKYGFYFTVFVGIIYMVRFHVLHAGPTPEQEYNKEMKIAAAEVEEYRKKSNDMVDEKTVTMGDAAAIERGKKIFTSNCFACHGAKGEGGVGPNLTDDYWLHGGTINEVFRTIKFGVPEKGMQSWEKTYSPSQIKDLASFVKSLKGTNPPNPKAPQGDLMQETTTSTTKDATIKK
jgi:cytochrome c oxidase cbb3-type subunit III